MFVPDVTNQSLNDGVQSQVFRLIKEQQESGIVFGLEEGNKAPNFTLASPLGEQVNLYDELVKGPVVLTFYRGSWCPFCNIQLRAYQQVLSDIEKLGLDLTVFNKTDRWILPLTATFIIDKEGIIRHANVNPDFMKRMELQEIINQLKTL